MVKVIVNLTIVIAAIFFVYSFFYFRVIPRLISHYRRVMKKRKIYDREFELIKGTTKENKKNKLR